MAETNSNPTFYGPIDRRTIREMVFEWSKWPNLKQNDFTGSILGAMEARYVELLVDWVRGEARADDVVELIEAAAGFWHIYHWTCYGAPGEPSDVAPLRRVAGRAVA